MVLLRADHPPAGGTTLIVSLGIISKPKELVIIEIAVFILVAPEGNLIPVPWRLRDQPLEIEVLLIMRKLPAPTSIKTHRFWNGRIGEKGHLMLLNLSSVLFPTPFVTTPASTPDRLVQRGW